MSVSPLPTIMLEPLARAALLEDLGRAGDLTTDAIVPPDARATTVLRARQPGVLAGLDLATLVFRLIEPAMEASCERHDGDACGRRRGHRVDTGTGARHIDRRAHRAEFSVPSERNCDRDRVDRRLGPRAQGAHLLHAQDDARLARDREIRCPRGRRRQSPLRPRRRRADQGQSRGDRRRHSQRGERAREGVGHLVKIELEVDTLVQLDEALELGVDAVLLDNMTIDELHRAVAMVAGKAVTEASGRVTPATAPAIAATGVDLISVGWLTHSAPILDIGLDYCDRPA